METITTACVSYVRGPSDQSRARLVLACSNFAVAHAWSPNLEKLTGRDAAIASLLDVLATGAAEGAGGEVGGGAATGCGLDAGCAALDVLRISLRANDAAVQQAATPGIMRFLVAAAQATPPPPSHNAPFPGLSGYRSLPALQCMANLVAQSGPAGGRNLDTLVAIGLPAALVAILRAPGRCRAHAVACHLAFVLAGRSPVAFVALVDGAGGALHDLLALLVPLLAWALHGGSGKSGGPDSSARAELAAALLRLLPALRAREQGQVHSAKAKAGGDDTAAKEGAEKAATLGQLADLLVAVLVRGGGVGGGVVAGGGGGGGGGLNGVGDLRPLAVQAMAFASDRDEGRELRLLAAALLRKGGIAALATLLTDAVAGAAGPAGRSSGGRSVRKAEVVPLLMVLTGLAGASPPARAAIRAALFGAGSDAAVAARTAQASALASSAGGVLGGGGMCDAREALMHPLDAPPGTLRGDVVALVTSLDSHVKRCSSELLLAACGQDMAEFTARVGLGNAAYMMHVRGAIKISEMEAAQDVRRGGHS